MPAEKSQLDQVKGDKKAYDLKVRPRLRVETIEQLQEAKSSRTYGRSRDLTAGRTARRWWRRHVAVDAAMSAASSWAGARDDQKVRGWLSTAATVDPGFIGFAVGRTSFWNPLVNMRANKITRDAGRWADCRSVSRVCGHFQKARTQTPAVVS